MARIELESYDGASRLNAHHLLRTTAVLFGSCIFNEGSVRLQQNALALPKLYVDRMAKGGYDGKSAVVDAGKE